MRFRGGGVGHKSTHEATDQFLQDRDAFDLIDNEPPEMELDSDLEHEDGDEEGNSSAGGDENQEEWMDEDDDEETMDMVGYLKRTRGKTLTIPMLMSLMRWMTNWVLKMVKVQKMR